MSHDKKKVFHLHKQVNVNRALPASRSVVGIWKEASTTCQKNVDVTSSTGHLPKIMDTLTDSTIKDRHVVDSDTK